MDRVNRFYSWLRSEGGVTGPTGFAGQLHRRYGARLSEAAWKAVKDPSLKRQLDKTIDTYMGLIENASEYPDKRALSLRLDTLTNRKSLRFGN
jgi:hypothetical protein